MAKMIEQGKTVTQEKKVRQNENKARHSTNETLKTTTLSQIKESSFLCPTIFLWNRAPTAITDASTESQAKIAIENDVKTLPI